MNFDDIEITHAEGSTTIKGLNRDKVKEFRDRVKTSNNSGSISFHGIKKIDTLRPDGTPNQTIFGEPKED